MSNTLLNYQNINIENDFKLDLDISYCHSDDFTSALLYQSSFLNFLKLDSYIDKEVNRKIDKLYDVLHKNHFVSACLSNLKENSHYASMCSDNTYAFLLLFSYDYFDKFYKCICELYNTGDIKETNKATIMTVLNNK